METEASQLLSEHEPAKTENAPASSYEPSKEDAADIKMVNKLFEKAKKHRKTYDEHWVKYYQFFRGKQWREARPSYRKSEVMNMVWQHIQSVVPITTDARPKWEYTPEEPSDREFADILNEVAESDWQRNNWSMVVTENVYDTNIYGTSLGSMEFNKKLRQGLGDNEFKSADPFYCFPDPNSKDVNKGGKYFIYAEPVDTDVLKKEYPDHKDYIKSDLVDLIDQNKMDINETRYKSPVDNKTVLEGTRADDLAAAQKSLKITAWIFEDDETEEVEESYTEQVQVIDMQTGQPMMVEQQATRFVQKLKYPNGRKLCVAGGVLLDNGPIPYDDGKAPFGRLVNYIDPRSFWGISEIEQLEKPQMLFNRVLSYMVDIFSLMGNPVWVVDESSGVDTDNLINRPGLVVEKAAGTEVRRESGVAINPDLFQLADRLRNWFNEQSGSNDVTRGVRPEGITAASAISSLQEAAQTRLRLKSRNLDAYLQDMGQLYLSRVLQFKTVPEMIRVTNNQNVQKYFKFHVEDAVDESGQQTGKKQARVRPYTENEQGQMLPGEEKVYPISASFDVRVNTGSQLPFAKTEKVNLAKTLFNDGAIDQVEYLKAVEWPNYEQVLERMKMAAQEKAMMEAQAQMGPPPTGQMPPTM